MAGTTTSSPRTQTVGSETSGKVLHDLIVQHNTLVDDLETLRGALDAGGVVATTELMADHATAVTWMTEVDADENAICDNLDFLLTPKGVIGGSYAFSAGAAATLAASGWVKYQIGGVTYTAEMPATVTLEDLGDITQGNYNAWRIVINRLGAVTTQSSPTVGGYASAQIALLALSGLAPTASTCTLGYLTLTDSDSVINIGTDNLNASGVTAVIYYERGPRKRISGLWAEPGAASTLTAASTTFGHGTWDIQVNGVEKAQIAAQATQALTDADTVATTKFGNILILSNLAGTGYVSLNAAGTPGATAMSYATAAAALAASDLVVDYLPPMFVPLALIKISAGDRDPFTVKTTNWNAGTSSCTITDATAGTWSRTLNAGFDSHKVTPPAIPADITAPLVQTLTAPAPSGTAVNQAADMLAAKIGDENGVAIVAAYHA